MSHKAAKAVRKILRLTGDDPREVKLTSKPFPMSPLMPGTGPGCTFHPRVFAQYCGRAIYLTAKKSQHTRGIV